MYGALLTSVTSRGLVRDIDRTFVWETSPSSGERLMYFLSRLKYVDSGGSEETVHSGPGRCDVFFKSSSPCKTDFMTAIQEGGQNNSRQLSCCYQLLRVRDLIPL
jgi:hypothetical protein